MSLTYYCSTCRREFFSEEAYNAHLPCNSDRIATQIFTELDKIIVELLGVGYSTFPKNLKE